MRPIDPVDQAELTTGNLLVNEPRQVWPIGFMSPGHIDSLVPMQDGFRDTNKASERETLVTRKRGVQSPRNMGNEMA
jgi:hypothetical protein